VSDLRDLNLFVKAAKRGNFAAAGRELNLSPPSTSQRIRQLESTFGARLFQRTTRSVTLTEEGRILLAYAERIITDFDNAKGEIHGELPPSGFLRVAASVTFGRQHIAPHVAEFLRRYPGIHLHLDLSDSYIDLVEHDIDVAIRIGNLKNAPDAGDKLLTTQQVVFASPAYLDKRGTPERPEDLSEHSCLIFRNQRSWAFALGNRPIVVEVDGPFDCNHGETIRQAAIDGLGVALRSTWDLAGEVSQGLLRPLLTDYIVADDRSIWAVYPTSRRVPTRVRLFVDFLREKFRNFDSLWEQIIKSRHHARATSWTMT